MLTDKKVHTTRHAPKNQPSQKDTAAYLVNRYTAVVRGTKGVPRLELTIPGKGAMNVIEDGLKQGLVQAGDKTDPMYQYIDGKVDGKLLSRAGVNFLRGQAILANFIPGLQMGTVPTEDDVKMAWAQMKFKNWSCRGVINQTLLDLGQVVAPAAMPRGQALSEEEVETLAMALCYQRWNAAGEITQALVEVLR